MAVGQIVSSDIEPERRRARRALLRIRLLSSIGLYPQGTIRSAKGIYHMDEQLAFVAVQTNDNEPTATGQSSRYSHLKKYDFSPRSFYP